MKIVSIDPGIEKVGYAVFNIDLAKISYMHSGLIKTRQGDSTEKRLNHIFQELKIITTTYKPSHIVVEQLFFFKNKKTIVSVAQAQGVILLVAAQDNIPVHYLTPLQIKQTITGYGISDKKSVLKMIQLLLNKKI